MLPLGVLAKRVLSDSTSRNRMLAAMVATVLLVGAFSTGLSINIQFGRSTSSQPLAVSTMTDPVSGEQFYVDEAGNALDDQELADLGLTPTVPATDSSGSTTATNTARPTAPPAAKGTTTGSAPRAGVAAPSSDSVAEPAPADACSAVELTASDQGITPEEIKIGILVPNLNELSAAGFSVGLAGDFDAMMEAWVNEFNRTKVACRSVTWVKRVFDVVDGDDMLKVCREMTQDEKVFAVITPGGYDSVAQLCIAKDAGVPLLNTEPEPADWYPQAAPYLWTMSTSKDRGHINHVRYLLEHSWIDADTKIGVIYDGAPHVAPATEHGLLPELDRQGVSPTKVFKLSADVEQALGQINQAVVDFQLAGVEFVFMPMNLIYKTQFMQSAENQNYFPQYTESDHNFGCFDFTTTTYPAQSYDGTICVTASDAYGRVDLVEYADSHPFTKYADEVYFQTHPDGYHENGPDSDEWLTQKALHISIGSMLKAWESATNRSGPNPTRPTWGAAMGQTGDFTMCVCENPLRFEPDKWDATTTVKGLVWHAEASDGFEERLYHEVTRPQPAYVQKFAP